MHVVDFSHPITDSMAVFPGDIIPSVKSHATMEKDGWRTTVMQFSSHTGTHMDAPAHMIEDGKTLDMLRNETFFGFGLVIDVQHCTGGQIELSDIKTHLNDVNFADYILLYTGWANKWGTDEYPKNFPVLSAQAAKWLTKQDLKGVGVDTISVDPVTSETSEIHKILLGSGLVIIENMTNLDKAGKKPFCLVSLPISLKNQDGGPTRVMGVFEN